MVGLCRLCASLRKSDSLIIIQDDTNEICQKLRECCQLSIQMEDALPKSLCQECLENLNTSHKFYMRVQDAQETLQTLFPSTNKGVEKTCESLAQTLSAASEQNYKRKVFLHEGEVTSSNKADGQNKKMKSFSKEQEISSKLNMAEPTNQNLNTIDSTEYKQSNIYNHDEGSSRNLQEVLKMLGMTKEEMGTENSIEILESIEEKDVEQKEDNIVDDQLEEFLEEPPLEEHHILQENVTDDDIMVILDNELVVGGESKDAAATQENDFDLEIKYIQLENELEIEALQSDADVEIIENEEANEPLSSLIEIKSWKSYTYLCSLCELKAASFKDLRKHAESEHDIKHIDKLYYKCYDCQKYIPRYNFYLNHIRSKHHPVLKLQCDSCDLSCENYEQLSFHRSVNCSEANDFPNLLPCTQCFKSFHSSYGLQNHTKLQHNTAKNKLKYKCSQCAKEFQQKNCLKVHELIHADTKKFSCGICDSTFGNKSGLELHLYSHIDEKSFKCNICDKSFKTFITLDQHQVIHSDVKAFKCDYCDKKFRKKIEKISHERTHTGEMPFQCKHCDKRFRYLSALNVHNRCHDGVKPFACEYCEQTFADSSNRNKHVKRKHPNSEKDENT